MSEQTEPTPTQQAADSPPSSDADVRAKVLAQVQAQLQAAQEQVTDLKRQLTAEQSRCVEALKESAARGAAMAAFEADNQELQKEVDMLRTKDAAGADASLVQFLNETCSILERCQFAGGETIEHPHKRASKCLTCGGNSIRGHEAGCEVARALVGHKARASKARQ